MRRVLGRGRASLQEGPVVAPQGREETPGQEGQGRRVRAPTGVARQEGGGPPTNNPSQTFRDNSVSNYLFLRLIIVDCWYSWTCWHEATMPHNDWCMYQLVSLKATLVMPDHTHPLDPRRVEMTVVFGEEFG